MITTRRVRLGCAVSSELLPAVVVNPTTVTRPLENSSAGRNNSRQPPRTTRRGGA